MSTTNKERNVKVEFVIAGCFEHPHGERVQALLDDGKLTLIDLVEMAGEDVVVQLVTAAQ